MTTVLVIAAALLASWLVYSALTGATLISFRTGSMAPTMPQGSVAVTVEVRASEVEVGEVITVQRAGESEPVTHRIIEIGAVEERSEDAANIRAAAPGSGPPDLSSPHARQIVMQGDDNSTPDHVPYALTNARKVVFAVPYLGSILMILQSPIGRLATVALVGVLVTWAFWPKPQPSTPLDQSTTQI